MQKEVQVELKAVYDRLNDRSSFKSEEDFISFCLESIVIGQTAVDCIAKSDLFRNLTYATQSRLLGSFDTFINDYASNFIIEIVSHFKAEGYEV